MLGHTRREKPPTLTVPSSNPAQSNQYPEKLPQCNPLLYLSAPTIYAPKFHASDHSLAVALSCIKVCLMTYYRPRVLETFR